MERFQIFEAPVLHPDLAARYPGIKSYAGQGIDDPVAVIRFSVSPLGIQTMRLSASEKAVFIEPISGEWKLKENIKLPYDSAFKIKPEYK